MKKIIIRPMAFLLMWVQNKNIYRLDSVALANLRVFYIGGYWRGQNDIVAQMLHGLKTAGANVVEYNTDENLEALDSGDVAYDRGTSGPVWLIREKVFPRIISFRPHIVVCNAGGLSFRLHDADTLRKWGIKLLGIALSEPDVYASSTSKIARNFDVFYSNDKTSVEMHRSQGVNSYQLPMGTDESFFHPVSARPEYECDVLHLGAAHPDRVESVIALAENFDTHVYGENWEKYGVKNRGFVFGEDTLMALSSAKIVVIFSRTPSGHQIIKPQLFNFLSTGCLVAIEFIPDLQEYFDDGKEIVGFNGKADMLRKIKYYLEHPEEANAIRRAGQEKALQFSWQKVWPDLISPLIRIRL